VRVHVAFTPEEQAAAPVGIVVDVIRATSSIAQALAAGYERVLCCAEIDEARALRAELGEEAVVGGERDGVVVDGFDVGASPREFAHGARARTLILTTTNGTRAVLTAAERCKTVLLGSLLNLSAVVRDARSSGEDVAILCSGFKGAFALDDAYCAGRFVAALDGERSDAAIGAELISEAWRTPLEALNARTYGPPGLEADIAFCAQVDLLDTVPRFVGRFGAAAEIVAAGTRRQREAPSRSGRSADPEGAST
jgi:2-phosphosulfolactate phosphatase